jgi:hypothetical protein
MNNGDMPASPTIGTINRDTNKFDETQVGNNDFMLFGLTKREAFAMAAMQGMIASGKFAIEHRNLIEIAERSYKQADLMLLVGDYSKGKTK